MEVLVATAIMSIMLGVLFSGFVQGHRQAFRGDTTRMAAELAESLLHSLSEEGFTPTADRVEIDDETGWSYSLEINDAVLKIMSDSREEEKDHMLELPELREMVLSVYPPDQSSPFRLTAFVPTRDT